MKQHAIELAGLRMRVIDEIDPESEFNLARELASRKLRPIAHLENEVIRRRIHGALARRGFSMSLISTVMREIGI